MNRKNFAKLIETEILIKCRRRCALCFGLEGDETKKSGQLVHRPVRRDSQEVHAFFTGDIRRPVNIETFSFPAPVMKALRLLLPPD
jgi:hypothetical protein